MIQKAPYVSVIIANHNGERWLPDCLFSLANTTYVNKEIIIVDNHSKDGSVQFVKRTYPETKVVELDKNVGFGKANNIGVEACRGEILFFLNTDIKIQQTDFFENLLTDKKKGEFNLCTPKILSFDGLDPYKGNFLGVDFLGSPGLSKKLFYIEGCSLCVRKKDFLKLGGFDEAYFMYGEDIDLSWRAHLLGMKIGICKSAQLLHYGGGSSKPTHKVNTITYTVPIFRRYEAEKNSLRTMLKNYSPLSLFFTIPIYTLLLLLEMVFYLAMGQVKMSKKLLSSLIWNVRNLSETLSKRKEIQTLRKANDLTIISLMDPKINKLVSFKEIGIPKVGG